MKRTIKTILLIAVAALTAFPVFAQPKQGDRGRNFERGMMRDVPPEVKSEAQIAVFDEYLELSEAQEEQIKAVDEEFALKGEQLREEKVNRRKKMMKEQELRNEHQQALHKILTKEQYSIYLEKKEAIQFDIRQRLKDHVKDGD